MRYSAFILAAVAVTAAGCGGTAEDRFLSEQRKAHGLVIILPGIEGESPLNHDIRRGLLAAGASQALPIYRWGRPVPVAGVLLNQVDFIGNRIEAGKIARLIERYQDRYPGGPVYLVGHSGGGGMAVLATEQLPADHQVDGLVLLSASMSASYDLTNALAHTRKGIVNFYNRSDVPLLGIGTAVLGNVDGGRGPSSGLIGFRTPSAEAPENRREAYRRLYQVEVSSSSLSGQEPHAAATRPQFVREHVAPWVLASGWPVGGAMAEPEPPALAEPPASPEPPAAAEPPAATAPPPPTKTLASLDP